MILTGDPENRFLRKLPIFDVPAEGYDELYGSEQLDKYEAAFAELGKPIKELKIVLDIGCATGLLGEYLRSIGFDGLYVAVDLLEERLTAAKKKADSLWMLIQADGEHLPFRDGCVDLAACVTVIHLLDVEKALKEIIRISRGYAAITLLKKSLDLKERLLKVLANSSEKFSFKEVSIPGLKDLVFVLRGRNAGL